MKLVTSTVAIVVPHRQFNDTEYGTTRSSLEREGCRVRIVAASLQPAVGSSGTTVRPQLLFSDVDACAFDAMVFVGGNGAHDFWNHPRAHNIVRAFEARGKLLGAICIAPVILANAGVFTYRKGTCHISVRREFESAGATYLSEPVVTDGNIVTASGPDAVADFAEALIANLTQPA